MHYLEPPVEYSIEVVRVDISAVHSLKEKELNISSLSILAIGFFIDASYQIKRIPFGSQFVKFFFMSQCGLLSNVFSAIVVK